MQHHVLRSQVPLASDDNHRFESFLTADPLHDGYSKIKDCPSTCDYASIITSGPATDIAVSSCSFPCNQCHLSKVKLFLPRFQASP